MKLLILNLTLLSLGTFAQANDCYLYDAGLNEVLKTSCSNLDVDRAEDEGYAVFNELSTYYFDGCLISENQEGIFERKYASSVCEEVYDEGWFVVGRI